MALTRRSGRTRFTIVLLVLTAITLLTLDGRGFGPIDSVRSAVLSAMGPVGDAAAWVGRPFTNAWDGAFKQDDLQKENDQLRQQLETLQGQQSNNEVAQEQLQQLLQQVGIPFIGDLATAPAQVVSGNPGNFGTTVELNKGSNAGIKEGMPVVTGEGLIGRVAQVSADRCVVELITGGGFKVGFSVVGTSTIGIAEGVGRAGVLRGTPADARQPIEVGQILVTSGLENSPFPPGLPIGTVSAKSTDTGLLTTSIEIDMAAETRNLVYASVVLYDTGP